MDRDRGETALGGTGSSAQGADRSRPGGRETSHRGRGPDGSDRLQGGAGQLRSVASSRRPCSGTGHVGSGAGHAAGARCRLGSPGPHRDGRHAPLPAVRPSDSPPAPRAPGGGPRRRRPEGRGGATYRGRAP